MSFSVINPWMLIGLAGMALPVIAHLLNRRHFDVVDWGAMQFLELNPRTKRRLRLEELLLLLLRMLAVAVIVLALSRPWIASRWLTGLAAAQNRDVVLILDGSYSMDSTAGARTPRANAIDWAHKYLDELSAGDTIAILDSHDAVRPVVATSTSDISYARAQLDKVGPAAGTSHLANAILHGIQLLSRTTHVIREIIVLSDKQAVAWQTDDTACWRKIDELLETPAGKPTIRVVDVAPPDAKPPSNFAVERLQITRERVIVGFPVRIKTKVGYTGGETAVRCQAYLSVNGVRLPDQSLQLDLPPGGEASVEFVHRFERPGAQVVQVELDPDPLLGDNTAAAAVDVVQALPVLLVDGDPQADPTRSETFFARLALSPPSNETPWIEARVVNWTSFVAADIEGRTVVVLANVPRLTDSQRTALAEFVRLGGGVMIAAGDRVEAATYNQPLPTTDEHWVPAQFLQISDEAVAELNGTQIVRDSLSESWLGKFLEPTDGGLFDARFTKWWRLKPLGNTPTEKPTTDPSSTAADPTATADNTTPDKQTEKQADEPAATPDDLLQHNRSDTTPAVVGARLNSGNPLFITGQFGRGRVLVSAVPLDAAWSTLPAKPDFVPWLHEAIFYLAGGGLPRNALTGEPLLTELPPAADMADYGFVGPDDVWHDAEPAGNELYRLARLTETQLPGIYRFQPKEIDTVKNPTPVREQFVVDFDRREADLTPLSGEQFAFLAKDGRIRFNSPDQTSETARPPQRVEFWYLVMLLFLLFLVSELWLTRRLVGGGHFDGGPAGMDGGEKTTSGRNTTSGQHTAEEHPVQSAGTQL